MIKAKQGNLMILGLSEENIDRLKKDEPISFNMKELGFPDIEVFIFTGKTEHEMKLLFKDKIHPLKTVVIDSNAPNN